MAHPARRDGDDDHRAVDDLVAILRTLLSGARSAGGAGLSALADGTDAALSSFIGSRVTRAIERGDTDTAPDLHAALAAPKKSAVTKRVGRTGAARIARRVGPLARRSPTALALRVGPAMYDVVTSVVREVDAVAAELVALAAAHRRSPDAERLHTLVVQVLTDRPTNAELPPDHAALVKSWAKRIGGQFAPFGIGGGGADADALAAAIRDIDPADLGPSNRRRRS